MRGESPEHECRQGRRCKARVRDDEGEFHGMGVERPNSLCRPCEEHAFADIRQLADDCALLLAARTEERSRLSGPKVSGSSDLPVPIQLAADTLLCEIDTEATRWAVRVTGGDPVAHTSPLTALCTSLGTLVDLPPQTVTVWIPHPDGGDDHGHAVLDGVDAVLRLSRLHQRAVKVLGLEPERDERLQEEFCHVCGIAALTMSVRTNLITCRACHNVWHQDAFTRLNNPLAAA